MDQLVIAGINLFLTLEPQIQGFIADLLNHNSVNGIKRMTPEQEAEIESLLSASNDRWAAMIADAKRRLGMA